ncbi:MAG: hypothetical protein D6753_01855 [Planctomycetota bacterium]|nr:MAG: hypothetical protein D6753_01855 [Planctomycetota bacterium]
MDTKLWHDALQPMGNASAGAHRQCIAELNQLIEGDLPLQVFLEQLLPHLCTLLGGVAAVAWLKAAAAPGALFGVRYQMENIVGSVATQKKHERLVQIAWQQRQPMLAEPAPKPESAAELQTGAANPTSHPLLFGPVLHMSEPIALLEVVLRPRPEAFSAQDRHLYLRGIRLLAEKVYDGLRRRMSMPAATLQQATDHIQQLVAEVHALQHQILRTIEVRLQQFQGWAFDSLDENQAFAKMVHRLLDQHGLRVQCPECGYPAILRCLRAGNAKNGAFVFDHYLDSGRTFHGGPTTVPRLKVVPKPARRSAISNPA